MRTECCVIEVYLEVRSGGLAGVTRGAVWWYIASCRPIICCCCCRVTNLPPPPLSVSMLAPYFPVYDENEELGRLQDARQKVAGMLEVARRQFESTTSTT
jgi:hypothetical protein